MRACFRDEAQFERFRAGGDFTNGLANITDAEYSAHYHEMVSALQALVDSSQVQSGTEVHCYFIVNKSTSICAETSFFEFI